MSRSAGPLASILALPESHPIPLLIVVAGVARFAGLLAADLDLDETWSWYFVHLMQSEPDTWRIAELNLDGPLFVALNLLIAKAFGLSVLGLRLPAAIFGTLSVPLFFLIVRRLHSARLAFLSALLAALSPYLVFYAKSARPYAQVLFFALLFTHLFVSGGGGSLVRRRLLLCATTFLAVASHYYVVIYLAAFYSLVLWGHYKAGDRAALRTDFVTGLLSLLALSPLLAFLAWRLTSLSVAHWQADPVTLSGVITEQFLFLGTSMPSEAAFPTWINYTVAGLLLLPLAYSLWRRPGLVGEQPLLSLLWLVAPLWALALGVVAGRPLIFFPRGFIASGPFLLAYWVLFTQSMSIGRWRRGAYVSLLLIPFLLSSWSIIRSDPGGTYYAGQSLMRQIAAQIEGQRAHFDVVVVHHWWLTQYVAYYRRDSLWSRPVHGLGAMLRREAAERGEVLASLEDVARLPERARVLLVLNELAIRHTDPMGHVVSALREKRPLLSEPPCLPDPEAGPTLFCTRLMLFGAEDRDAAATRRIEPANAGQSEQ